MRSWLLGLFGIILSALVVSAVIYSKKVQTTDEVKNTEIATATSPVPAPSAPDPGNPNPGSVPPSGNPNPSGQVSSPNPSPVPSFSASSPVPGGNPSTITGPDLTVDATGLSRSTVVISTPSGIIKFKFYTNDAPKTVQRVAQLIQQGFYNGLTFHRVQPGFVIQGGDPQGNGTGGSGQKLDAEFNNRRHVEGTVAMARGADPNSADSQFYIALGSLPYLDHNYTVFGQVIEGMDVAKKIKMGDKMTSVTFQ